MNQNSDYLFRLEVGSGNNPSENYTHLDADPNAKDVHITGDVRACFLDEFDINKYPQLYPLSPEMAGDNLARYREIKLMHFIEHIHWYNQPALLSWLWQILEPDGFLSITTPNLKWIINTYIKHDRLFERLKRRFFNSGKSLFPIKDHPDINISNLDNLSRWAAFKMFSGGSYDSEGDVYDYHLGVYDERRLSYDLKAAGFLPRVQKDNKHGTLVCRAYKPSDDSATERFVDALEV